MVFGFADEAEGGGGVGGEDGVVDAYAEFGWEVEEWGGCGLS